MKARVDACKYVIITRSGAESSTPSWSGPNFAALIKRFGIWLVTSVCGIGGADPWSAPVCSRPPGRLFAPVRYRGQHAKADEASAADQGLTAPPFAPITVSRPRTWFPRMLSTCWSVLKPG